jgi:hypothetical protein
MNDNDIEILFTYHNPQGLEPEMFDELRNTAKILGKIILKNGKTKDKEKSVQKLRECIYYAIASIVVPQTGE